VVLLEFNVNLEYLKMKRNFHEQIHFFLCACIAEFLCVDCGGISMAGYLNTLEEAFIKDNKVSFIKALREWSEAEAKYHIKEATFPQLLIPSFAPCSEFIREAIIRTNERYATKKLTLKQAKDIADIVWGM
jgi:hypothetical protein